MISSEEKAVREIVAAASGDEFKNISDALKIEFARLILRKLPGRKQIIKDAGISKKYCAELSKTALKAATALEKYQKLRYRVPQSSHEIIKHVLLARIDVEPKTIESTIEKLNCISFALDNPKKQKSTTEEALLIAKTTARYYRKMFKHLPRHHHSFSPDTYNKSIWLKEANEPPYPFDKICLAIHRFSGVKFSEGVLRAATVVTRKKGR